MWQITVGVWRYSCSGADTGFYSKTVRSRGSGVILPQKVINVKTLGNGVSGILRPRHRIIISHFF